MSLREIPGDPLTGAVPVVYNSQALPRTQILLPEPMGPVRSRTRRVIKIDEWPVVPDPEVVAYQKLKPGAVVAVRTRRGVRTWMVRTIGRTHTGRRFATAMDKHGLCHSFLLERLISVDTLQRHVALNSAIKLKALGPGDVS